MNKPSASIVKNTKSPELAAAFLKQGDRFGAAVCAWWAGQNLLDVAPYIADARALQLVLLGDEAFGGRARRQVAEAALLALAPAARAEDGCAAEVTRLCPRSRGDVETLSCLRAHEQELGAGTRPRVKLTRYELLHGAAKGEEK